MGTKILKFEVCYGDSPHHHHLLHPPPSSTSHRPAPLLPSIVSPHLKENTVFSMHKRLGAVNRRNPPGPMENTLRAAATVSPKGERAGGRGGRMDSCGEGVMADIMVEGLDRSRLNGIGPNESPAGTPRWAWHLQSASGGTGGRRGSGSTQRIFTVHKLFWRGWGSHRQEGVGTRSARGAMAGAHGLWGGLWKPDLASLHRTPCPVELN
ncbi:unnamed protein product [Pleuronectes platessa]|uniref:Uncharacterized protein n=1 Tax=Pleuronectes platessa TaxID=8262 RepID=A0A9N7ULM5_PLEPL|nr:unnamed protein product [Pleuronectes platessa]